MMMGWLKKSLGLAAVVLPALVHSFAPTDSTQDAVSILCPAIANTQRI